jgi:hypothetical protein
MPSFNRQTPMVRFPTDLRQALQEIAESTHKSFAGLAKGAMLQVHKEELESKLGKARVDELLKQYVSEKE